MPYAHGMDQQRSPRYPSSSLSEAIRAAKSLWAKERRTAVNGDVLARAIGYKSHSGPARALMGAMRQYGLLEKQGAGLRLSDVAMEIVHGAEGSEAQIAAIRWAALQPDLFRELYSSHPEASEDAVKSHLILRKGFAEAGSRLAASAYKDTLALAKLPDSGYSIPGETDEESAGDEVEEPHTLGRILMKEMGRGSSVGEALVRADKRFGAPLLTQTLVVSIPRNFRVDFTVHGDEIKKEDLAKIKNQFNRWIEGLEEAFE